MSHENDKLKFGVPSDAIVIECPHDVNPDDDSVRYYGGLLVCESASTEWRRRIVACVNYCAGIPDDALLMAKEEGPILTVRRRVESEKRRDELRGFIERIAKYRGDKDWPLMHLEISEAIASVEGGAA